MRFDTEEAAAEALDREDLVLINQFMRDHPTSPESVGMYQQTPVEDIAGPVSEVPIARHRGQTFRLPTRISSIQMLCRRLDTNLHRYFILPGHTNPQPLYDLLHPVTSISDVDEVPKLYFGKIQRSFIPSPNPQPYHLRMTRLYSGPDIADFFLKQNHVEQESRGIDESKIDHYVIFWSRITPNGIGLCAEHLGWGEYALVPERYTRLLDELSES
ncbi:hypothetical protein [Pseudoxanthomonas sp. SE1]|uniref:hypothetical protein n=1 Tax=Pseudoxanthomonas sp. SE1 TaxID=1664560 RepID=UPI00240D0744|nr:hypothetical protein [Pseudoxanthomonas sp. SE1]WFC40803.1 hypothetical protein OY559_13415 [Pseudoxanthomonas sp. SE1]